MIKEYNYISIKEILSRLLRHPLLQDIDLEQVIQYTLDFIGTFGMPKLYEDVQVALDIVDGRATLPTDLVSIVQVMDNQTKLCLRSMTDTFNNESRGECTFKVQGGIIFTSFQEGSITIAYKAVPVDAQGCPMLIDNSIFLRCLQAYIKVEKFTILFDMGRIQPAVYNNAQQEYCFLAGQLQSEFTIPSISEMESLKRDWTRLVQRNNEFSNGFKTLGDREYIKIK